MTMAGDGLGIDRSMTSPFSAERTQASVGVLQRVELFVLVRVRAEQVAPKGGRPRSMSAERTHGPTCGGKSASRSVRRPRCCLVTIATLGNEATACQCANGSIPQ